jgi:hypothetical protein
MKSKLLLLVLAVSFFLVGANVNAQDGDVSELTLSKYFKGESFETTKKFPVSPNYTMLKMQMRGEVKSGTIKLTLIMPKGNEFKTLEIDVTSDVTFEQTLDLKKNPTELTGDWQLKIQTEKAVGSYHLVIYTR